MRRLDNMQLKSSNKLYTKYAFDIRFEVNFPSYINGLETIHNQNLLWVYLEKPTREKLNIVSKKFPIHELNMEDCLSKNQLPKIDRYDDHIFVILQFPTTICQIIESDKTQITKVTKTYKMQFNLWNSFSSPTSMLSLQRLRPFL